MGKSIRPKYALELHVRGWMPVNMAWNGGENGVGKNSPTRELLADYVQKFEAQENAYVANARVHTNDHAQRTIVTFVR